MSDPEAAVHGDEPTVSSPVGLKDHKELSTAAFERTRMPMVLSDARQEDNPIVLANQAFLDLTGYTASEVVGRNCRFLQGAGTSLAAVAEVRLAVAAGKGINVELLNYKKDGTPFWNQLHLSPILDDEGDLAYYFASQIDVTEYRKVQALEASEHRLLMEVDHRAKNVLAVVDSIVRLSNASDAAGYAAAVQRRVQSLSQAHALLSNESWKPVSLRKVIEAQMVRFSNNRISLNGPDVAIAPEVVQSLSLIIHEMTINAITHGSLSKLACGSLDLEWKARTPEGRLHLSWIEQGGRPARDRVAGFGTVIVRALVERQLQGSITQEWRDDGMTTELEFVAI